MKYRENLAMVGIIAFIIALSPSRLLATEKEDFDKFVEQQNQSFNTYLDEQEKDYAAYVEEIRAKWGEFIGSTKKVWVDYGDDKESRSRVDFQQGSVIVDVLLPKGEKDVQKVATEKIKAQLKRMVSDRWPTGQNPLAGQIAAEDGKTLSSKNVDAFVEDKLKSKLTVSPAPAPQKEAAAKEVVSVKIDMVPDHLKIRAERYKPIVDRECKKQHIDPSIVFGVIHTESYFNPMARSHVPAYGLMQLVPASGAMDAYKYVFNEKKKPSPDYLYNPENNIVLGVGYLALTKNVYFSGVDDPAVAYLMTVAAYNTGAGNVARALTGKTSLKPAAEKAKKMTPAQVHEALRKKLPYKETQDYIQRVFSRSKLYRGL
jgi:membrane-bound lytic murein transglycosylase C